MTLKHRMIDGFLRLLSAGVIACGAIIVYSGTSVLSSIGQPFRENLQTLAVTIKELDKTVEELQKQSEGFDGYLAILQKSLAATRSNVKQIDLAGKDTSALVRESSVKLLNDTAGVLTNASDEVKRVADRLGSVPFDPAANDRKSMYSTSGQFTEMAGTCRDVAGKLGAQAEQFQQITSNSLGAVTQVIGATGDQVTILRKGPVEQIPGVLKALSEQLSAHVKLIDASYGLLNKLSRPIIGVGIGFMLLGLRGVLMGQPEKSTSA